MSRVRKVFIRADANKIIGSGHIMRCMSIARALLLRECEVAFIVADHEGEILLTENDITHICIDSDWQDLDREIEPFTKLLVKENPDLLIVDSYYVTNRYFDTISSIVPIAYVDDQNLCFWNVNYLINYNIFSSVYDYSAYADTRTNLILGSLYTPLRDEFRGLSEHTVNNEITEIMVSAGGADPEQITERIIENICPVFDKVTFHFIIGALNPRIDKIRAQAGGNVAFHINEHHMSKLMQKCDVAIAAAGSTLYELCACGTPTITYGLADNQMAAVEEFARQGIMLSAGDSRTNKHFIEDIVGCLKLLVDNKEERMALSRKMKSIVDGYGADRIASILAGN